MQCAFPRVKITSVSHEWIEKPMTLASPGVVLLIDSLDTSMLCCVFMDGHDYVM